MQKMSMFDGNKKDSDIKKIELDENEVVIKDSYFKTFFNNKNVAIVLLAKVIPELKEYDGLLPTEILKYVEVTYLPAEFVAADLKVIRMDVFVKVSGVHISLLIDLEMQTSNPEYQLENRVLYYSCRMIADQLRKNEIVNRLDYDELEKIYCVWILSYSSNVFKDYNDYVRNFSIRDLDSKLLGNLDKFNIVMLDATNKYKENEVVEYLKTLNSLIKGNKKSIEKYMPYDIVKDEVKRVQTFEEMRTEELLEEGRKLGRQEGRKLGRQEGRELGRQEGEIQTVIDLYQDGFITKEIALKKLNITEEKLAEFMERNI